MNRKSLLSIFLVLILGISLLTGCGGGGGGNKDSLNPTNPTDPTDPPSPTTLEQINLLLDNFETANETGDVALFKSCITDPCTYYDGHPTYHKDINYIDPYISFKYANRQIKKVDSTKVTVTSVNVNKELAYEYLESYDLEILEIVMINNTWKITKIDELPFTPNSQDSTELNQLFNNIEQGMLGKKDLNQISKCVCYPFEQYSYYDPDSGPKIIVFNKQEDLQNYLRNDLNYSTFDIVIENYHFIGSVESEYIAIIELRYEHFGTYDDGNNYSGNGMPQVLLKKVNNQWKIYKINGDIFY